MRRFLAAAAAVAVALGAQAGAQVPALRHVALDLPGPPARVLPFDVDRDGRQDLVVVVGYTEIEEIGEDRVEDLIEITKVIPALFDRREIRVYLATPERGYVQALAENLPFSILHLEVGSGTGLLALTDEGLSSLRFEKKEEAWRLHIEPLVADPPVLALTRNFYASLEIVHDLNGDGILDVLLPSKRGQAVYLGRDAGLDRESVSVIEATRSDERADGSIVRMLAMPEVRDFDGDGVADLFFGPGLHEKSPANAHVLIGSREGTFRPLRREALDCHDTLTDLRFAVAPTLAPWPANLGTLRDIDGDGRAEVVIVEEQSRGDSMRKELEDAKRPIQRYRFHRLRDDLSIEPKPYYEMEAVGHTMEAGDGGGEVAGLPLHIGQFVDLDGDGRLDLVTVTLDFSLLQSLRVLVTKRIGVGVEFHVWAQESDGTFREVPDLDLSEKLKFDLNDLKLARFAQFAGDFDGDGRQDFVHLGRGKTVTVHRGQPGCRYPKSPDLSIPIEEEPASLDLVSIEDLDGDGRADIRITRPLPQNDPDVTARVRLDLYLSGWQG